MTPSVVVFACGNISRGDDALGPCLLQRLAAERLAHVTTIEDFQLQIEHVLDMRDAALALFLDAAAGGGVPIGFYEVRSRAITSAATHALEPAALLDVYRKALGHPPPPAFVLSVCGENFGLGERMSDAMLERLEVAWPIVRDLCAHPDIDRWRCLAAKFAITAD